MGVSPMSEETQMINAIGSAGILAMVVERR
jgi:hypothetical protein